MRQCTNCAGTGIVGSGPKPWEHAGQKSTCTACNGTGTLKDEAESDKPKSGGILGKIFG